MDTETLAHPYMSASSEWTEAAYRDCGITVVRMATPLRTLTTLYWSPEPKNTRPCGRGRQFRSSDEDSEPKTDEISPPGVA